MLKKLIAIALISVFGFRAGTVLAGAAEPVKPNDLARAPMIGEDAPAFSADTTQGKINFPRDYKNKWVVLFSYSADFTPVATTEVLTLAAMAPEFKAVNCDWVGISGDSLTSHISWIRSLQEKIVYKNMKGVNVALPLVADPKIEVLKKYGLFPSVSGEGRTYSALFIIDPKGRIRSMLFYPANTGRNFMEIKRMLIALQTADAYSVSTPSDWQPGEDVIVPVPATVNAAKERQDGAGKDYYNLDWYLGFRKLGRESIPPAPVKKER
jgi:peroxiredoxin (alkyl hydroperoxide reductase subunit C)